MRGNRRVDTAPEVAIRQALHAVGLRFRKDYQLVTPLAKTRADIVFARQRVAVFVDGCFWHGCPEHCRLPQRNREYWEAKISRNQERDRGLNAALEDAGWTVIRIWEHEPVDVATERVRAAVRPLN